MTADDNPTLATLKEINRCADFLVEITHCTKSDALKATFAFFAELHQCDYSPFINLVPDWLNSSDGESNG